MAVTCSDNLLGRRHIAMYYVRLEKIEILERCVTAHANQAFVRHGSLDPIKVIQIDIQRIALMAMYPDMAAMRTTQKHQILVATAAKVGRINRLIFRKQYAIVWQATHLDKATQKVIDAIMVATTLIDIYGRSIVSIAFEAMIFARHAHRNQVRKYSGTPYADHLAEVAGIVATVAHEAHDGATADAMIASAWLHDCVEDQDVTLADIESRFGATVALGVAGLSDLEQGNRATRKRLSCERLAACPGWIQTIKCADLISNTSSIVRHDPHFSIVYLREKRDLLNAMTKADRRLWALAWEEPVVG